MVKRKIVDYRINEPNPELFVCVGNVFPYNDLIKRIYSDGTLEFKSVIDKITNGDVVNFFNLYLARVRKRCISTYVASLCNELTLYRFGDINYYSIKHVGGISAGLQIQYINKWSDLYDTYQYVYDAIRPYDITLKESNTYKHGGTTKEVSNSSGIDKDINNYQVKLDKTDTNVYGFNSNGPVPQSVVENSSVSLDTLNNEYENDRNHTITHGRTIEQTRNYTRLGNIGNKTQQELIVEQRKLLNDIIFPVLYEDFNSIICSHRFVDL